MTWQWEPLEDIRYTDQDVRRSSLLRELATSFARRYMGDWGPMVEARDMACAMDILPIGMARKVLNVMRTDLEGIPLLRNQPPTVRDWGESTHQRRLKLVKRQRPAVIDLPCVWHKRYVLSMFATATMYHYLHPVESTIRWYPHTGEFRCMPRTVCGRRLPGNEWLAMTNNPTAYPVLGRLELRHLCRLCDEKDGDYD
jgi:hypothetical protein